MKISYNWLKNYVNINLQPEETARILNSIGLEVEAMESVEEIPGGLEGVVVGEVVECIKHPDADKLSLTKVDAGGEELLQIVCGAPNVSAGQKVFVATVGTTLTMKNGEQFKIKRSKIRGIESNGMICAEDELGIGDDHEGIMVLPCDSRIGMPAKQYLKLKDDTVFEIGLTPNRIDAASHIGVARDLSAYLRLNSRGGEMKIPSVEDFEKLPKSSSAVKPVGIEIVTEKGAPRYAGLTLDNITVADSPGWMQIALTAAGVRPINNVVDVTNFILLETGQPLHAFDRDKIEGERIVVREARQGEKFVTLDGVTRELSSGDVMICNVNAPMCIGGVFGGEESGVTEKTTSVFLESACFNPVSIRKTSKRHNLKTEASFRFERGTDPENVHYALKRAAILLHDVAGAKVVGDVVEHYPEPFSRPLIELDFGRIQRFIGKKIDPEVLMKILGYLDFETFSRSDSGVQVSAPLYRVDVTRECDVVEELLRIYGYNNVELPERVHASINATQRPDPERIREQASDLLSNNGFYEIMNNSLTKGDYYASLKTFPSDNLVRIMNPLSSDLNSMRQTLILSGLEVVEHNINHQRSELRLFEIGNVYFAQKGEDPNQLSTYGEKLKLSMLVTGSGSGYWRNRDGAASFFMLKGYLELLFSRFGISIDSLCCSAAPADIFSEGLLISTASGKEIGMMGTVNGRLLKQFGIKQEVYAAEIDWKNFVTLVKKQKVQYVELPKFPEVKRDLALLIDENVSYTDLRSTAFATEKKILKQVTLFDVYRGDKIPAGKKQYAMSFLLQDDEKTLTDRYVEDVMNRLLTAFMTKFGATLR